MRGMKEQEGKVSDELEGRGTSAGQGLPSDPPPPLLMGGRRAGVLKTRGANKKNRPESSRRLYRSDLKFVSKNFRTLYLCDARCGSGCECMCVGRRQV
jgi:hypothetical protein